MINQLINLNLSVKDLYFDVINIIIMKNVKEMMFDVTIDEDSEKDQDTHRIQVKPNNKNYSRSHNKYESITLSKGLFSQTEEDVYCNVCPIKKQEPQSKPPAQDIKISHRSSHLLHEIQFESSSSDKEQSEADKNQNNTIFDKSNTEIEKEFIIAPLSSKQLLNIVFDESDEEEEDLPVKNENGKKKKENLQYVTYNDLCNLEIFPNQKSNIRQFIKNEMKKGTKAEFTISRNQSGLNVLWPEFVLIFNENGKQFAHAKKMMGNSTANYYISSQRGVEDVESNDFIAKLRSNFMGSVLNILTSGLSPKKVLKGQIPRYIQATIKYNGQLLTKKPRQFQVYIIKDQYKYMDLQGTIKGEQIGLDVLYKIKQNQNKLWFFKNRKPIYSEQTKGFILNFGGRVQKPSVKNFILEDPKDCRQVMMLGKLDEDIFRMEVSYPLKPYIALGISLANFESKYIGQ